MTPLDKPLRRQIDIEGQAYTVVLDAEGVKLVKKAHRNGVEWRWAELLRNEANGSAHSDATPSS
jgi:hypothetical protein